VDTSAWNPFVKQVRDALKHLHDLKYLRQSPLALLFAVDGRLYTPVALQEILTRTIERLEPSPGDPDHEQALVAYECLFYLYVQRFSQQEVADQLGISTRQLRREQGTAIDRLACMLWQEYDLASRLPQESGESEIPAQENNPAASMRQELAWIKDAPQAEPTELNQALSDVLDLARPLAEKYGVRLEVKAANDLPCLSVHPVALNQMLLGLLSVAIHLSAGHAVRVAARLRRWEIEIQIQSQGSGPAAVPGSDQASLDVARQLAGMCGGRLALAGDGSAFRATLTIPALEQLPVLVIEDNADTLQLFRRYASGTRYRLITSPDPEQALALAENLRPRIVVLDVMMPQVGGWKVLARLRQHPLTGDTPIVVCTILPQEELALSLGANAYVRKPVTREDFLATLDRQIRPMNPGSR
jgi:CheY-like chemotaxis protein